MRMIRRLAPEIEFWERELKTAHVKAQKARTSKTIRKWNKRAIECRAALSDLRRRAS